LLIVLWLGICSLSQVVYSQPTELTSANWEQELKKGTTFVKFYAPWCGHCKNLAPTWETLSQELRKSKIAVGKIDCTSVHNKDICELYEVKGFPTLYLIKDGKATRYEGQRNLEDLSTFASTTLPSNPVGVLKKREERKWSVKNDIIDINDNNYQQILSGTWLIDFYADWCPFCQDLIPEYEKVATALKDTIKVGKVVSSNSAISRAFGISDVPTIKLLHEGQVYNFTYTGQKSSEFIQFVETGWKDVAPYQIPPIKVIAPSQSSTTKRSSSSSSSSSKEIPLEPSSWNQYLTTQESLLGAGVGAFIFLVGVLVGRTTATPAQEKPKKM